MATIPQTITNGNLSVPLAANDNSKGNLFGRRLSAPQSPVLIAMAMDALTWMYESGDYTTQELTAMANYLIWLMGKYGLQASNISGSGGSVTPVTPGGLTPSRIDFEVSATSYMVTGATSKTISQFLNLEIDFIRGGISQSTLNTQPSYITWDKTTALLTVSPALAETEVIAIIPS